MLCAQSLCPNLNGLKLRRRPYPFCLDGKRLTSIPIEEKLLSRIEQIRYYLKVFQGEELVTADALSRATIEDPDNSQRIKTAYIDSNLSHVTLEKIRKATEKDPGLQSFIAYITSG